MNYDLSIVRQKVHVYYILDRGQEEIFQRRFRGGTAILWRNRANLKWVALLHSLQFAFRTQIGLTQGRKEGKEDGNNTGFVTAIVISKAL